ncbi:MAG: TetR family transcriptional regulator [Acidimicrobiales bacterium]
MEESRETRQALLKAAADVFAEKGLNGARLDEIAERAGVTKGAIYSHFDGREDLLVEALRAAFRSLQLLQAAADAPDLVRFVDETAPVLVAPEGKSARMLSLEVHLSAARSEPIADLVAEWHAGVLETMRDRVPPGAGSPEAVTLVLNLLLLGLSHIDAFEAFKADRDEVVAIVNRLAVALLEEGTQ